MLRHARNKVNARRFDARMAQNIRELDDVLVRAVKRRREQVAEVVREDLPCIHTRAGSQLFHFRGLSNTQQFSRRSYSIP